jgi:gamma-glutamyl AIG2-like cyclotransferase
MSELLFSYGTLQREQVQLALFNRILNGNKDVLKGYCLATIEITDEEVLSTSDQRYHLIAIPSNDKKEFIEGVALEMSMEEILRADEYETEDYKRIKVVLESGKKSWAYVSSIHASASSA